jgi:hypothetical protein
LAAIALHYDDLTHPAAVGALQVVAGAAGTTEEILGRLLYANSLVQLYRHHCPSALNHTSPVNVLWPGVDLNELQMTFQSKREELAKRGVPKWKQEMVRMLRHTNSRALCARPVVAPVH